MRVISEICGSVRGNIDEARRHIEHAFDLREIDEDAAAWYRGMAQKHLEFNRDGHAVISEIIDMYKEREKDNVMMPGMMAAYRTMHADLMKDSAKVKAMIADYDA